MKNILYSLLIAQSLLVISCGEKKSVETTNVETAGAQGGITIAQEQFNESGMHLGSIEEKTFPVAIQTSGIIDVPPENRAVVSATMGGYIKRTPLLIGDIVKKGQVLVTIENPEFVTLQQNYMEVKQQLSYLNAEYDRQKKLKEENITSQKSFLKAESEFKTANAGYNGLRKQLMMLNISPAQVEKGNISAVATIFAPISGSITKMNVTKGTYVSPSLPILEIIDNEHIHLELSVFEKDIMKLKKGQTILFRIPEASAEIFKAEVYLIGASIEDNRTIKVHGHLKDEGGHTFLTGMFVNAEIVTETTIAKALPSEAIVEEEGRFYVLRVLSNSDSGYVFEQLEVEKGSTTDGFTEVKNANRFSSSDRFLTKGAFDVVGE